MARLKAARFLLTRTRLEIAVVRPGSSNLIKNDASKPVDHGRINLLNTMVVHRAEGNT